MTNPLHIFRAWQQRRREKRIQKEREEQKDLFDYLSRCVEAHIAMRAAKSKSAHFPSGGIVSKNTTEGGEFVVPAKEPEITKRELLDFIGHLTGAPVEFANKAPLEVGSPDGFESDLHKHLSEAIKNENYELAAVLRDRIKKSKEA
jgi:hypothetical protein